MSGLPLRFDLIRHPRTPALQRPFLSETSQEVFVEGIAAMVRDRSSLAVSFEAGFSVLFIRVNNLNPGLVEPVSPQKIVLVHP